MPEAAFRPTRPSSGCVGGRGRRRGGEQASSTSKRPSPLPVRLSRCPELLAPLPYQSGLLLAPQRHCRLAVNLHRTVGSTTSCWPHVRKRADQPGPLGKKMGICSNVLQSVPNHGESKDVFSSCCIWGTSLLSHVPQTPPQSEI
jgi:hypothetical protein